MNQRSSIAIVVVASAVLGGCLQAVPPSTSSVVARTTIWRTQQWEPSPTIMRTGYFAAFGGEVYRLVLTDDEWHVVQWKYDSTEEAAAGVFADLQDRSGDCVNPNTAPLYCRPCVTLDTAGEPKATCSEYPIFDVGEDGAAFRLDVRGIHGQLQRTVWVPIGGEPASAYESVGAITHVPYLSIPEFSAPQDCRPKSSSQLVLPIAHRWADLRWASPNCGQGNCVVSADRYTAIDENAVERTQLSVTREDNRYGTFWGQDPVLLLDHRYPTCDASDGGLTLAAAPGARSTMAAIIHDQLVVVQVTPVQTLANMINRDVGRPLMESANEWRATGTPGAEIVSAESGIAAVAWCEENRTAPGQLRIVSARFRSGRRTKAADPSKGTLGWYGVRTTLLPPNVSTCGTVTLTSSSIGILLTHSSPNSLQTQLFPTPTGQDTEEEVIVRVLPFGSPNWDGSTVLSEVRDQPKTFRIVGRDQQGFGVWNLSSDALLGAGGG